MLITFNTKSNEEIFALKKQVDLLELKIKEIDLSEAEKKTALDRVKNQKEYQAVYKELEILGVSRQDEEDRLVSAWHQLEALNKRVVTDKASVEKKLSELRESIIALEGKIAQNLEEEKVLQQERLKKITGIPQQSLERYEKMKGKSLNPIVSIIGSSCSGCYYLILPQDLAKIKKGELLHCRNCHRLLYFATTA